MTLPLLIGGATTSRAHTALRIAPAYSGPVIHVLDASRAVGVAGCAGQRRAVARRTHPPHRQRLSRASREPRRARTQSDLATLAEARANGFAPEHDGPSPRPAHPGTHVFDDWPLDDLVELIDWTPFFRAWELARQLSGDPRRRGGRRKRARRCSPMRRRCSTTIVAEKWLTARGTVGLWPVRARGRRRGRARRGSARASRSFASRSRSAPGGPTCASPTSSPRARRIGSAGSRSRSTASSRTSSGSRPRMTIITTSCSKRSPTASPRRFAERLHQHVRTNLWGYAPDEALTNEELIREDYRGIRPAPGYPACPDHSLKPILFGAARRRRGGDRPDREFRDAADLGGVGLLLRASRQRLFRRGADRPRPARGLCRAARGRSRHGDALAAAQSRLARERAAVARDVMLLRLLAPARCAAVAAPAPAQLAAAAASTRSSPSWSPKAAPCPGGEVELAIVMHTRARLARLLAQPGRCRPADAGRMGLARGRQRRAAALSGADAADRRRADELCLRARPCDPRPAQACRRGRAARSPLRATTELARLHRQGLRSRKGRGFARPAGRRHGQAPTSGSTSGAAPCRARWPARRGSRSTATGSRSRFRCPPVADASASPISFPPRTGRSIMPRRSRSAATATR